MEIDPDVRLATRLAVGRSWRGSASALFWLAGIAGFALLRIDARQGIPTRQTAVEAAAILALLVAPSRPLARLLDLERVGFLDHIRLCGRRPSRVLAAFLAGSMWPFVLLGAVLFAGDVLYLGADARIVRFALILFVAVLDIALLTFATGPGRVRDGWVITFGFALLAYGGYLGTLALEALGYLAPREFDRPLQIAALVVAIAMPPSVWLALHRLRRPVRPRVRPAGWPAYGRVFARLVPRDGPPEFLRRLRSSLGLVAVPIVALQAVFVAIALAAARRSHEMYIGLLAALPFLGLPAIAMAAAMTIRHEIQSRSIELVRLTPQRSRSIVLGWFAGLSLAFWIATLAGVVVLMLLAPGAWRLSWALPATALLLPSVAMLEGFDGRLPGSYVTLGLLIMGLIVAPYAVTFPSLTPIGGIPTNTSPWGLDLSIAAPLVASAVALAASCGRLDRVNGPALTGVPAAIAIAGVALTMRLLKPTIAYPRAAVGVLPFFAALAAAHDPRRSAPWRRMAAIGAAAFVAVDLVAVDGGVPLDAALMAALCAAVTVSIGLLAEELWYRWPVLPIGVCVATLIVVVRFPYVLVRTGPPYRFFHYVSWALKTPVPADLGIADLGVLLAIGLALALAHRYRV